MIQRDSVLKQFDITTGDLGAKEILQTMFYFVNEVPCAYTETINDYLWPRIKAFMKKDGHLRSDVVSPLLSPFPLISPLSIKPTFPPLSILH